MPLINGCKFSCEPCIRGHRASSCKHTERMLIEVRKPGRPLESCGHEFATCTCKKLTEWLMSGQVISSIQPAGDGNTTQSSTKLVAVCPPPETKVKKARLVRTRGQRKSAQRRKAKTKPTSSSPSTTDCAINSVTPQLQEIPRGRNEYRPEETFHVVEPIRAPLEVPQTIDASSSWVDYAPQATTYSSVPITHLLNSTQESYQPFAQSFEVR